MLRDKKYTSIRRGWTVGEGQIFLRVRSRRSIAYLKARDAAWILTCDLRSCDVIVTSSGLILYLSFFQQKWLFFHPFLCPKLLFSNKNKFLVCFEHHLQEKFKKKWKIFEFFLKFFFMFFFVKIAPGINMCLKILIFLKTAVSHDEPDGFLPV